MDYIIFSITTQNNNQKRCPLAIIDNYLWERIPTYFEKLKGLTFQSVRTVEPLDFSPRKVEFITTCGKKYELYHEQDCCEEVDLKDLEGDLSDLVGSPIVLAEVASDSTEVLSDDNWLHSWTFYRLATCKGYVVIRFYGESNGCYAVDAKLMVYGKFIKQDNSAMLDESHEVVKTWRYKEDTFLEIK